MNDNDIFYAINPCSICEQSTENKPFKIGEKRYCICEDCRAIIEYVCKEVINSNKKK